MINYNFYKRNLTQIIHFQLNNLPNFSLLIQSKSTVIVMFFFFSYLTPRINAYYILLFIIYFYLKGVI